MLCLSKQTNPLGLGDILTDKSPARLARTMRKVRRTHRLAKKYRLHKRGAHAQVAKHGAVFGGRQRV